MKKSYQSKKKLIILAAFALPSIMYAQTNTFPSSGNTGIGTSSPNAKLQVCGDSKLDGDLNVKDSLKAKDVKIEGELSVVGDATFNSSVNLHKYRFIGGDLVTEYIPGLGGFPGTLRSGRLSGSGTAIPLPCINPTVPFINAVEGLNVSYHYPSGSSTAITLTAGVNGIDGIVDLAGNNPGGAEPKLLINNGCGKDVEICTGAGGGRVAVGNMFEVGLPITDANIAANINASEIRTGLQVTTNHNTDNKFNTRLFVNRNLTNALTVTNTTLSKDVFTVTGSGSVLLNTQDNTPYSYGLKINLTNPLQKCIALFDPLDNKEKFLVYGNGHVYCRELFVKLDFLPDFVFEPNYKLQSYQELESYLKANKHLPGIPSEKEVVSTNLNVGEMQALQLQKIEELTLYVLDLNKRLEQAEAQNTALQAEIKAIKNK